MNLKDKLKEFPNSCKYSLEEVITAEPKKLHEIAEWAEGRKEEYKFMIGKYKNFTAKKKEYNAYDLASKLQVNVCPYCNINSTFTIENGTRPEFDHFYDKTTYPILSLSFYNLIPSCHICNSSLKGDKNFSLKTHIHPYIDSFDEGGKILFKGLKIVVSNNSYWTGFIIWNLRKQQDQKEPKEVIIWKVFKLRKGLGITQKTIRRILLLGLFPKKILVLFDIKVKA